MPNTNPSEQLRELTYALFRSNIDWDKAARECGDPRCRGDCRFIAIIRQTVREWDGGILSDDNERLAVVPKQALGLLYECAKDYERRIPRDGHNAWAEPFFEMFEGAS